LNYTRTLHIVTITISNIEKFIRPTIDCQRFVITQLNSKQKKNPVVIRRDIERCSGAPSGTRRALATWGLSERFTTRCALL